MMASRKALLVANRMQSPERTEASLVRAAVGNVASTLTAAPRSTIMVALCLGAIVVGPKQIIRTAARWGITAWIGAAIRKSSR